MKTTESVIHKAKKNNEPVFVIRAQDKCSIDAINAYLNSCAMENCSEGFVAEIVSIVDEFEEWQNLNKSKVKIPD